MNDYISVCYGNNVLVHHGIKGQKWGVRRFQNPDGTWTDAGKKRYGASVESENYGKAKIAYKNAKKDYNKSFNKASALSTQKNWEDVWDKGQVLESTKKEYKTAKEAYKNTDDYKELQKQRIKTAAKVGATMAATALAAYGAYKLNDYVKNENVKIARYEARLKANDAIKTLDSMARKDPSLSYKFNATNEVRRRMEDARNDSFKTAASNVIRYKRSKTNYNQSYGVTSEVIRDKNAKFDPNATASIYKSK